MFNRDAPRLLREIPWPSVDSLAEELFVIFRSRLLEHKGTMTIDGSESKEDILEIILPEGMEFTNAITITRGDDVLTFGENGIEFNGEPVSGTPFLGDATADDGFTPLDPFLSDNDEPPFDEDSDNDGNADGTILSNISGITWGRVVSGSGQSYIVNVYGNGPQKAATKQVSCYAPQVAGSASIPEESWVLTMAHPDRTYSLFVPVWL